MIRLAGRRVSTVHRLVWETFVGFDNPRQIINHKNSNKCDSRLENLEVCDYSYNLKYAFDNGERTTVPVSQYTLQGKFIKTYPSIKEACKAVGISKSCICSCCRGKAKSAGGFIWSYKDELPVKHKEYGRGAKSVIQYDLNGNIVKAWKSMYAAKDIADVGNISACCRGLCKTAGGFIWKYANNASQNG